MNWDPNDHKLRYLTEFPLFSLLTRPTRSERPSRLRAAPFSKKTAIEAHLLMSTTCRIDGEPLSSTNLLPLHLTSPDSPPSLLRTHSFSSRLSSLQQEWDHAQSELHDLRMNLSASQREFATAHYENDAAKRVIARLLHCRASLPRSRPPPLAPASAFSEFVRISGKRALRGRKRELQSQEALSVRIASFFRSFTGARFASLLDGESVFTAVDGRCGSSAVLGTADGRVLRLDPSGGGRFLSGSGTGRLFRLSRRRRSGGRLSAAPAVRLNCLTAKRSLVRSTAARI
jgi:hypothetical protein